MVDSNDILSFKQKSDLLKFIRTFYFIDYLNQVNYLKKIDLLTTEQYKLMINNHLVKDDKVTQYLNMWDIFSTLLVSKLCKFILFKL